ALPPGDGVLLSMAKFMRILRVDARARTAVVQPGVRNAAISEAAAPFGLYYAPDPSSQIDCTIGGNVAENSGGVHCLKYGLTVHNVLRLRGFTMAGGGRGGGGGGAAGPGRARTAPPPGHARGPGPPRTRPRSRSPSPRREC